jgi:hypothetical protein
MERYLFTSDGYRCLDVDGTVLYQSEGHEDLFQFVDKDETPLDDLLRKYLSLCVDIDRLSPISYNADNEKNEAYREMLTTLSEVHPFCTGEYLDREIALYFSNKLAEASLKRSSDLEIYEVSEKEYKTLFDCLLPGGFGIDGNIADVNHYQHFEFYKVYRQMVSGEGDTHTIDSPFFDLHRAKLLIKDFLYWVLDSQAKPFGDMTPPQRLYLYNTYHLPETFKIANTVVDYYWGSENGIRFDGSYMGIRHEIPLTIRLSDGRYMGEIVQGITSDQGYEKIDSHAKELFLKTIAEIKNTSATNEYCAVYGIRDLFTLLFIECQRIYESKISIRRCERCGHYFIANKQMYKYCERPIDEYSLKTCRDVGAKESAKKKLSDDPLYYLYNKAYRTHHARIRAGHITKGEFDAWATEAKRRMNAVLENPLLWDAYVEWLRI